MGSTWAWILTTISIVENSQSGHAAENKTVITVIFGSKAWASDTKFLTKNYYNSSPNGKHSQTNQTNKAVNWKTVHVCILYRPLIKPTVRVVFGHHMRVGCCLWATELARVMRKIPHFGIVIIWGAVPMNFPVFWISVSGCSLNSYGTSPKLWVQKELVKFRQGTQDTWLRFAKFLREFLGYHPLISSKTWEM